MNKKTILKIALLSCCLITASQNAIAGNIPEIAKSFKDVSLSTIELMTTIPSLFVMLAILFNNYLLKKIDHKTALLIGLFLCGIGGIIPYFINEIYLMIISRAIFGFGVGMINANLLIMIVSLFKGKERSQMIGLQGSIGGFGSFVTTYLAGMLLIYGWHVSFLVYLLAFIIFLFGFVFVPKQHEELENKKEQKLNINLKTIIYYSIFSFVSVNLATFFIIKCSSLITMNHYGSVRDGSTLVMLISIGSLLSGAMYGSIYNKLNDTALIVFYLMSAIAFVLVGTINHLYIAYISAFLLGYGYLAFVPFLQEKVAIFGSTGTTTLLILQSLGSFITPYYGVLLNNITSSLNIQFIITGCLYILLISIYLFTKKRIN